MFYSKTAKRRLISGIGIKTPFLVPSFSSSISQYRKDLNELINFTTQNLTDVSLVSAYDLYYDYVQESTIYGSELLIIDSGCYESKTHTGDEANTWSVERYLAVLKSLTPKSKILAVSYDSYGSIEQQIWQAKEFQEKCQYPIDFLCKPKTGALNLLDWQDLSNNVLSLGNFSVFGVTEEELGNSLLARCQNLLSIRKLFMDSQIDIPIHIFGCLEPANINLYYLCGADIFDGLAWKRFWFDNDVMYYRKTLALQQGRISDLIMDIERDIFINNFAVLTEKRLDLIQIAETSSIDILHKSAYWTEIQKVVTLLEQGDNINGW